MTSGDRALKRAVRARMEETGESYSVARRELVEPRDLSLIPPWVTELRGRKFHRLLDPSGGPMFEVGVSEDPEQWGVWYVDVRLTASRRFVSDSVYGVMMRAAGVEGSVAVEGGHPVTGLSDEEADDALAVMGWRRGGPWVERRAPVELLGVRVVDG